MSEGWPEIRLAASAAVIGVLMACRDAAGRVAAREGLARDEKLWSCPP